MCFTFPTLFQPRLNKGNSVSRAVFWETSLRHPSPPTPAPFYSQACFVCPTKLVPTPESEGQCKGQSPLGALGLLEQRRYEDGSPLPPRFISS